MGHPRDPAAQPGRQRHAPRRAQQRRADTAGADRSAPGRLFGLQPGNSYHELHRQTVRQWVDETTRLIAAQGSSKRKTSDMLDPRVPRSLRDVEDPIVIYYDA